MAITVWPGKVIRGWPDPQLGLAAVLRVVGGDIEEYESPELLDQSVMAELRSQDDQLLWILNRFAR
ncbi:hypothetical protein [Aestuariivirga sp.]|jgi:hypothetical protein|uniref:hypothetical protein n=1 Tax=Aestuariivirga sp. TaxID=2650926 RepID=UPI0037851EFB